MRLERIVNCIKLLNWETHLPRGASSAAWTDRMRARGAKPCPSDLPGLVRLRLDGHELLLVERSGRVSIRLDYLTPHAERTRTAERLFRAVVEVVRRPEPLDPSNADLGRPPTGAVEARAPPTPALARPEPPRPERP